MSNVLIGIIGVILFIGLALAGALFLGPRFQEATANSKAATVLQAVSQVSMAYGMYRLQEGKSDIQLRSVSLQSLSPDYLKSEPILTGASNIYYDIQALSGGRGDVPLASTALRNGDAGQDKKDCENIQRIVSGGSIVIPDEPMNSSGCYYNGVRYIAYSRI